MGRRESMPFTTTPPPPPPPPAPHLTTSAAVGLEVVLEAKKGVDHVLDVRKIHNRAGPIAKGRATAEQGAAQHAVARSIDAAGANGGGQERGRVVLAEHRNLPQRLGADVVTQVRRGRQRYILAPNIDELFLGFGGNRMDGRTET